MKQPRKRTGAGRVHQVRTLSVDIGGSGIKALVLDQIGAPLTERARIDTPRPATPGRVLAVIEELAEAHGEFDRVSVGFPGVVREGVTETAYNLDSAFIGFRFAKGLAQRLRKPVRLANDADIQGLGVIAGLGVELVITLGTGVGSALFVNGTLVPNLELAHHPFRRGETYEDCLGKAALGKHGRKQWNASLAKAIRTLQQTFNYDRLYIGGGHAKKVNLALPANVKIVPNEAGLWGGLALWRTFESDTDGAGSRMRSSSHIPIEMNDRTARVRS